MTINALAWASLWLYASVGRRMLNWDFPDPQTRVSTIQFISGGALYAISIGIAFINVPWWSRDLLRLRPDLTASRSRRQPLKSRAGWRRCRGCAPFIAPQAGAAGSSEIQDRLSRYLPDCSDFMKRLAGRSRVPPEHVDHDADGTGGVEDRDVPGARVDGGHHHVGPYLARGGIEVGREGEGRAGEHGEIGGDVGLDAGEVDHDGGGPRGHPGQPFDVHGQRGTRGNGLARALVGRAGRARCPGVADA